MSGEAVRTIFHISCNGWKGESRNLQYSVSLLRNTSEIGRMKDDSDSVMLSYGSLPYINATLPAGPTYSNHSQMLVIKIFDSYGASTQFHLKVQVIMTLHLA